ncbi:hypothetical protein JCM21142_41857 [Saccharicrinis fermentans DSM 9555 = JCM 21142]|uniref:Uncharacterized protein n=1 Tax=Saccharicrinis fermentans DSM 9555 = JCM 21142 TaxID=869213 RepID=W7Y520_9BACT|nr:hypothetical protein JCM21142_41857 [Saccharicrinis fermentans DSM 9555 = JCM 21142]
MTCVSWWQVICYPVSAELLNDDTMNTKEYTIKSQEAIQQAVAIASSMNHQP